MQDYSRNLAFILDKPFLLHYFGNTPQNKQPHLTSEVRHLGRRLCYLLTTGGRCCGLGVP